VLVVFDAFAHKQLGRRPGRVPFFVLAERGLKGKSARTRLAGAKMLVGRRWRRLAALPPSSSFLSSFFLPRPAAGARATPQPTLSKNDIALC
jgi:hypothetical protein